MNFMEFCSFGSSWKLLLKHWSPRCFRRCPPRTIKFSPMTSSKCLIMASSSPSFSVNLCFLSLLFLLPLTSIADDFENSFSMAFPLTFIPVSSSSARARLRERGRPTPRSNKLPTKFSRALMVSFPVGTPAQVQNLLLDTGSQLSWVQCGPQIKPSKTSGSSSSSSKESFDPAMSTTFSPLSCDDPVCKPRVPDYSVPTACDQKRRCQYSYFYADGTLAEGKLVKDKVAVSTPLASSPIIIGCSEGSKDNNGILGMNMGRLSFVSQSRITRFSYCVPAIASHNAPSATGALYLGGNPKAVGLKYVNLMKFPLPNRMPNLDPFVYTVPMKAIRVGTTTLNISQSAFRPNAGGSGQTFVDSGTELTYLVDEAYDKVKEAVVRLAGSLMKKDYSYARVADICFDARAAPLAARRIGGLALVLDQGVEISITSESLLFDVGNGAKCVPIGRSSMLGSAGNIIGVVHQQNMWIEYDIAGSRIGFGVADCSRSYS